MKIRRAILVLAFVIAAQLCCEAQIEAVRPPPGSATSSTAKAVTFNKDVAPIIFQHCASCHRPDQAGPFNLLTYADVSKRSKQIAEVVKMRYMPPWLPERGLVEFDHCLLYTSDAADERSSVDLGG